MPAEHLRGEIALMRRGFRDELRQKKAAVPSSPRVTFLTDIVTPYFTAVFRALARRLPLTVLYCSRTGTRGADWAVDALGFDHRIIGGLVVRRRSPDATDYYLSPRIPAALARSRPDVVIAGAFSVPTLYAAGLGRLTRTPLLVHSDGTSDSERSLGRHQQWARTAVIWLADGFIANSAPAAARFRELGATSEAVFHAPHSTNLEPLWEVARCRRDPTGTALRLLHVGRLIPRKGVDRLLRALRVARQHHPDVELTIVGSGPQEPALRALALELDLEVDFRGFIDQDGLPAEYAAADAFVFPTLDDPFGLVVLEAAASGLPIIGSLRGGATADLVAPGYTGLVVDPDDTAAFADAIVALARNPTGRAEMGRAAHASTLDRGPDQAAQGYVDAVRSVLAGRGRRG